MKLVASIFLVVILFVGCKKLEDYNGNNVEFELTQFEQTETMTFKIPNTVFTFPLSVCWDIPFGSEVDFDEMVDAENPNPYAHLVYDIIPKEIKMELVGVDACDMSMMRTVEVFMVDKTVQSTNDIVYYNPNNPDAPYNAKKMGEYYNANDGSNVVPDNIGNTMYLQPDTYIKLDEFIHDQDFKIYMVTTIDKTFVEDYATIKTTLKMDVKLKNEK